MAFPANPTDGDYHKEGHKTFAGKSGKWERRPQVKRWSDHQTLGAYGTEVHVPILHRGTKKVSMQATVLLEGNGVLLLGWWHDNVYEDPLTAGVMSNANGHLTNGQGSWHRENWVSGANATNQFGVDLTWGNDAGWFMKSYWATIDVSFVELWPGTHATVMWNMVNRVTEMRTRGSFSCKCHVGGMQNIILRSELGMHIKECRSIVESI